MNIARGGGGGRWQYDLDIHSNLIAKITLQHCTTFAERLLATCLQQHSYYFILQEACQCAQKDYTIKAPFNNFTKEFLLYINDTTLLNTALGS